MVMNRIDEKYSQTGEYQSPKRKGAVDEEYVLSKAQAIYSTYVRDLDGIKYTSSRNFSTLRAYAEGRQSEDKYMPVLMGTITKGNGNTFDINGTDIGGDMSSARFNSADFKRKALGHINWKIVSPAPKLINKILSTQSNAYDITIECVDENSINKQKDAKWTAWVESQQMFIEQMAALSQAAEVPYQPPQKRIQTIEELELHEANGGFKLNYAKEGEKIVQDAWNISNEEEIDEKCLRDLASINYAAYRVIYDREIGKEVFEWIDPEFAGIQYSKHNDFRDSSYAYRIIFVPAYKLVSYGIDINDIPRIARNFESLYGNPSWKDEYDNLSETGNMNCGFFKVAVLDVEWIEADEDKNIVYTTKLGTKQVKKARGNEQPTTPNKELIIVTGKQIGRAHV